jgi:hypothetical protein
MSPELLYSLLAGAVGTGAWLGIRVGMLLGAAGGVAGSRWWAVVVGLLIGMGLGANAQGIIASAALALVRSDGRL